MFEMSIHVETVYIAQESNPANLQYVHAYQVTITNRGSIPAQLLRRYWRIKHAEDKIEEVHGDGVVGKQPWIRPGESFQYTSGAVLMTEYGSMVGYYVFEDDQKMQHHVQIPEFLLVTETDFIH